MALACHIARPPAQQNRVSTLGQIDAFVRHPFVVPDAARQGHLPDLMAEKLRKPPSALHQQCTYAGYGAFTWFVRQKGSE